MTNIATQLGLLSCPQVKYVYWRKNALFVFVLTIDLELFNNGCYIKYHIEATPFNSNHKLKVKYH